MYRNRVVVILVFNFCEIVLVFDIKPLKDIAKPQFYFVVKIVNAYLRFRLG